MQFKFTRTRRDKFSKEHVLQALERAAEQFDFKEFGKRDFVKAKFGVSASGVKNAFDKSWSKAIAALRVRLQAKGKDLNPQRRVVYSDENLFSEMERIWKIVGQRPSKNDWNYSSPRYSYNVYRLRFRGWENACMAFIQYKMHGSDTLRSVAAERAPFTVKKMVRLGPEERREPSQTLINRIWKRDLFRCIRCGKSPATHLGAVLEVDHIIPWARGGKTMFENLQTLCSTCNRSKGAEA